MKSTGIVRRVDELGRVVLPKEIRKTFDIKSRDPLEIFVDSDCIILKKYEPSCVFCGEINNNVMLENKRVCQDCIEKLKALSIK